MNIIMIIGAIFLIAGALYSVEFLNHGIHLKIFKNLKAAGFLKIDPLDGAAIAPVYTKIRPKYSPSEYVEYDYAKVFKEILMQRTPIGHCYAFMWLGVKAYSSSIHILLDPKVPEFIITKNRQRTDNLSDLSTVVLNDKTGQVLKINSALAKDNLQYIDEFVLLVRRLFKKRIKITLFKNVLTISQINLLGKTGHTEILEFIRLACAVLLPTNGNFA